MSTVSNSKSEDKKKKRGWFAKHKNSITKWASITTNIIGTGVLTGLWTGHVDHEYLTFLYAPFALDGLLMLLTSIPPKGLRDGAKFLLSLVREKTDNGEQLDEDEEISLQEVMSHVSLSARSLPNAPDTTREGDIPMTARGEPLPSTVYIGTPKEDMDVSNYKEVKMFYNAEKGRMEMINAHCIFSDPY